MKQLLIVEDNKDILAAIEDLLSEEGYVVTTADSGEAALEILCRPGNAPFDCVILDNFMPGMNGQEFLERLAEPGCPLKKLPPVLVITTNPDIIQAAHLPIGVWLLPKPLDIARLIEMVGTITAKPA
jgi:two-component system, OmpR family, response regulator CpxR